MNKIELEIEGMSCDHCVAAVTEALGELPGVSVDKVRIGEAHVQVRSGPSFAGPDRRWRSKTPATPRTPRAEGRHARSMRS